MRQPERAVGAYRIMAGLHTLPCMPRIKVFRFRYFNRASQRVETSSDQATEEAIREIGAELIPDSGTEVDTGRVGQPSGFVMRNPPSRGD
jgi:hypothetical protein